MKKILTGLLILGLGFGMSGCANTKLLDDSGIKRYKSTKQDVKRKLGSPDAIQKKNNGKEIWSYTRSKRTINTTEAGIAFAAAKLLPKTSGITQQIIGSLGGKVKMGSRETKNILYTFNRKGILIAKEEISTQM